MKFMLKKHKLHLSCLFCCNHTCFCVNMVSVTSVSRYITSASRYHPRYQRRSSMYIRGLIPQNFAELAEAVPIGLNIFIHISIYSNIQIYILQYNHDGIQKKVMRLIRICFPLNIKVHSLKL